MAGDLWETYQDPHHYAAEALRTVPLVILSQMRRNLNPPALMLQGALTFGAQANANLTPPGTGDMGLAVIVQPSTNTSTITLRGGSSMMIVGTLYAPAATVSLAGNSSATGTGL